MQEHTVFATYAPATTAARDSRPRQTAKPAFDVAVAIRVLGNIMKTEGIPLADMLAVFPDRPTTEAECSAIATWIGERAARRIKGTPSPAAPAQYDGLAPAPKDGKRGRAWHYALHTEEGVKFYRVKRGYKPGFYFVDVQASDEYYPIRNRAAREAILGAIAKDPQAALALYGQEVGACGRCGRTLTSEYRKLGIGPICIDK